MEHVLNVSVSAINAVSKPATYGFTFDCFKSKAPTLPPSNLNLDEIKNNIGKIKQHSDLPVMAGFGIKTADDAKILAESSEGIVIGSSIVEMINEESKSKEFDRISNYLKEMKAAIS